MALQHAKICSCIGVYDITYDAQGEEKARFVEWKMVCDACMDETKRVQAQQYAQASANAGR